MQAIHISSYNNIIMAHNLQHTKYNNKNIMHIYDTIQIEFIIRLLFNIYIYVYIEHLTIIKMILHISREIYDIHIAAIIPYSCSRLTYTTLHDIL